MGRSDSLRADAYLREESSAQRPRVPGALLIEPLWRERAVDADLDAYGVGQISLDRVWVSGPGEAGAEPEAAEPADLPRFTGGQVATAMLGLARLGLRTAWAGAIGDDDAGRRALAPLELAGVDCGDLRRVAGGATRQALIRVAPADGAREVRPERDPRVQLTPSDLANCRLRHSRALLIDAEDPVASLAAAEVARAAGVAVILDADRPGARLDALLAASDFPIVPRSLADFLGQGSTRKGLEVLADRARIAAVVTLGSRGAMAAMRGDDAVFASAAFAVNARDTTGAGDAFHAGFIFALLAGAGLAGALRTANAVGALNCEALGAQGGLPDRERLAHFLDSRPALRTGDRK